MTSSAEIDSSAYRAAIPPLVDALLGGVDDLVVLIGADLRPKWSSRPLAAFFDESGTIAPGALGGSVHPGDQAHMQELRSELLASPGKTVECNVRVVTTGDVETTVRLRGTNYFHDPLIDGFVVTVHWPDSIQRDVQAGERRSTESRNSRTSDSAPTVATSVFAPADLVEEVSRSLTSLSDSRGVVLRTRVDPTLPTPIRAPRRHLRTILTHLTTSAVRSAPVGGETPCQVEFAVTSVVGETDRLRFAISTHDSGGTLGDDVRWASTVGDAELMSAAALVDQIGSSIDISSDNGSRTLTFEIGFQAARRLADRVKGENAVRAVSRGPATPPAATPRPASATPAASALRGPTTTKRGTVLVVDDSEVNRLLATSQLDRLGYDHIEAGSGEEALRIMRRGDAALVLMDWHMPGLDGLAATERWRAVEAGAAPLPIISMTASAMAGDRERCLAAGANDYLPKPVSIGDLASMLERWMPAGAPVEASSPTGATDPIEELIAELGDVAVVLSIVQTYVEMIPVQRSEALVAWRSGDRGVVRRCAHTLKSTATMLGCSDFAAVCAELEALAKRDAGDLTPLLGRFADACDRTAELLREVSDRLRERGAT